MQRRLQTVVFSRTMMEGKAAASGDWKPYRIPDGVASVCARTDLEKGLA
jgi:hypothetical protein